jgi:hypothetical protein
MSFRPNVHDELTLNGVTYRIAEHPAAPGIPYGQEGRAGIVYQLLPADRSAGFQPAALKVFRARFRTPALVSQAEKLAAFADLPGLTVCRRTVLTPQRNADLLRREPDLTYAVLMPWIEGPTWVEVMLEKRPLTPQQALDLARAFADILSRMEQNGIAHCDLSGPNVLLPMLAGQTADRRPQTAYSPSSTVELVDVEGLYAPGLPRPEALPSGSSGYAHRTAREGLWGPTADRFAGAVLLAEMLGWGDESVREACYGETYFDPAEMPAQGRRQPAALSDAALRPGASLRPARRRPLRARLDERNPGRLPHLRRVAGRAAGAPRSTGFQPVHCRHRNGRSPGIYLPRRSHTGRRSRADAGGAAHGRQRQPGRRVGTLPPGAGTGRGRPLPALPGAGDRTDRAGCGKTRCRAALPPAARRRNTRPAICLPSLSGRGSAGVEGTTPAAWQAPSAGP